VSGNRDPFTSGESVPVAGGALHVARAGARPADAEAIVVAVHGITASHHGWRIVARELLAARPDVCMLAPDLRGRGHSAGVGPPYGIAAHATDVATVLEHFGCRRAVLAGHSMGAFVVARAAADDPDLASAVVLIDGGLRIPAPDDIEADALLDAVLGPAIARLKMTFASPEEYIEFWRRHPAFAGRWNDDVEAYVRADLTGEPGAFHSVVSEAAVRVDGTELLRDEVTLEAAGRVRAPLWLLRAPRGLLDDPNSPLIPEPARDRFAELQPSAQVVDVPDVNHYTITLGAGAAMVAHAVVAAIGHGRGVTA
jgi:lipase